jgi:hypothetical protein
MTIKTNLNIVHREMNQLIDTMDVGSRKAANELAAAMEQIAKNEIQGKRQLNEKAEAGKPPKNRTGNLRRSIKSFKYREGFATYRAVVGPTMIYARAVELGGEYAPRSWQGTTAMKGFPYMQPAWEKFKKSGIMKEIIAKNVMRP